MAYRNGTYVAFHADGTNIPGGNSDIDYYQLMCGWSANKNVDFNLINSHEKASAVRDSSKRETLRQSLLERLRNSRNMVLLIGETTQFDTDWVPLEIEKAVDLYKIPIIVTYTKMRNPIRNPKALSEYWPPALNSRINSGAVGAIHIPFRQTVLFDAISQLDHNNLPVGGALTRYSDEAYKIFGISG